MDGSDRMLSFGLTILFRIIGYPNYGEKQTECEFR